MNVEEFREFCISMPGVMEKMPFGRFAKRYDSILVFYVCGHMFCYIDINEFSSVTVKLATDTIEKIRQNYTSHAKPLNMSPKHWLQLNLNGDISDRQIYALTTQAYEIVKAKYFKTPSR